MFSLSLDPQKFQKNFCCDVSTRLCTKVQNILTFSQDFVSLFEFVQVALRDYDIQIWTMCADSKMGGKEKIRNIQTYNLILILNILKQSMPTIQQKTIIYFKCHRNNKNSWILLVPSTVELGAGKFKDSKRLPPDTTMRILMRIRKPTADTARLWSMPCEQCGYHLAIAIASLHYLMRV